MSKLVDEYMAGIFEAYDDEEKQKFNLILPACKEKIERLKSIYPYIPSELLEILTKMNGTEAAWLWFFNPDFDYDDYDLHYFVLCSIETMLDHAEQTGTWAELYSMTEEDIDESIEYECYGNLFCQEINPRALTKDWLFLGKNQGMYSSLYIDFNPSIHGKIGQIVGYYHDPDSYSIAAESLEDFLKMIIKTEFKPSQVVE